jgi:hypothetical protein
MSRMSENVGAPTSRNRKGLHGLYRDNFTFYLFINITQILWTSQCTIGFLISGGGGRFHNQLCDCYLLWPSYALLYSVFNWYPSNFWCAECIVSCSLVFPVLWLIALIHFVFWPTANLPPRVWVCGTTAVCCGWRWYSFKVNICEDLLFEWANWRGSSLHFHSRLLVVFFFFWTLSIVRYSKEHSVPETGSVSVLGWETSALLGSLGRANFSHWT